MFKTKEIVNIALISAIAFLLSLVILFRMPNGGSITVYLVPLFFAAFNNDLKTNVFIAIVTATLQVLFGGYVLNPIQVMLDYYLPVMFICICMIFRLNKYINLFIGSLLAMVCYVISGMIFFEVPFLASIIYNATFFIPTIILNLIIFALINPRLGKIYESYQK
ncbi:energy-coupled thiamine transporter ThiT [Erysipelotrichaceae bacterium OttesenSCG-928-M19]|nr:energy-coupled thiamine transporter ThiT [Erysipelotrichaceae bacterium OttesenSCG-928-M19]